MCQCRLIILFILTFLIASGTKAQERLNYFFRHITQSDGLLHNQVLSIAQDDKGFIWVATPNGLQRYDGSRFVYYPEMLGSSTAWLTSGVEMYADEKNNLLWISNNTNIERMEMGKNNFTYYDHEKLINDSFLAVNSYRDINNMEWILGPNTVYQYDSSTKRKTHSNLNILPPNVHRASYIVTDSVSERTWVATPSQLFVFDKKTKRAYSDDFNPIQHPLLQPSSYGPDEKFLRFVMIDSKRNIWVTGWGDAFYKYDDKTKKVTKYLLSVIRPNTNGLKQPAATPLINCMLEDDNHSIWVGTENAGLLRYNPLKDNFDYIIAQGKNSESIQYRHKIFNLFQDKDQNIWISTDKGISIFNPYRQFFNSIRHEEDNPLSIGKSEIISFIQTTNGDMFIGTWGGGIAVYDSLFKFKRNIVFNKLKEEKNNDDVRKVWSFLQVDDKTLYAGCQHGYLQVHNMATGTTRTLQPPEMEGSTIRCMEKDANGNVWFGLHNGKITKWEKKQDKFFAYGNDLKVNLKTASIVLNIFIDRAQRCWVSTESGFKQFDLEKMVFSQTWLPDKNKVNSISGKTCQGIDEYNDSILLIGTIYGGINFFNRRTNSFSSLGSVDGLPSNNIYALKKDTAGYIWFTTDYGLCKLNPVDKKIVPYRMDPGVINSSFIANKFYPLQNGQWLTFTIAEAISFFPHKVAYQDRSETNIEITGFRLFDKPVSIDSLLFDNKPLRLSYKENFFTVEFAALNFSSQQQTNYFYRLSSIDKDWVNGNTNRFASYTDLPPGEYIFNVKAENANDLPGTTSFKIIISPPFWKTWWFISAIFFLILTLIYVFIKWREKNIKAIEAEKRKLDGMNEQLSRAKLETLRSQMNPHFIFNCINSIDALIQSNDKYHATVYLNKFAKLIRDILDSSKQNTVTLSKDLDTLKLYIELEQLRHENKFTTEIIADEALLQDDYRVPPLIIQPFVENAILHGIRYRTDNSGKLSVSVMKLAEYLQYSIEDNGVGRGSGQGRTQKEKVSYGIDISNDRVRLFNNEDKASVEIIDLFEGSKPVGTKVTVLLKIQ
jgi:ligand-binding sensor domain-containing protein